MKVTVLPIEEMQKRKGEFDVIVTVLGPWDKNVPAYNVKASPTRVVIKKWMNDVSYPEARNAPDAKQIGEILEAMKRYNESAVKVGIACQMGISRSSAVAYAILCQESGDAERGWMRLMQDPRHSHFYPNRLIVALADDLLGMGGEMIKVVNRENGSYWMQHNEFPISLP
jgi:predicted protein tyrosine phosphatase